MDLNEVIKKEKKLASMLPAKPQKLSREELKKEILQFIRKHKICTLATSAEDMPRSTPVRYRSKGMTIYVFAEGGGKIANLRKNPNISVSLYGAYKGFKSVKGLQMWGKAEIIEQKEKGKFAEAQKLWETQKRKDIDQSIRSTIPSVMKAIKITVSEARYLNFEKGIINQTWHKARK
jgi:nitroimidazol reductase NimA-like FMN-containing flavoprotein (pyridoxamine 5'-phosphate oxidase superfamily)